MITMELSLLMLSFQFLLAVIQLILLIIFTTKYSLKKRKLRAINKFIELVTPEITQRLKSYQRVHIPLTEQSYKSTIENIKIGFPFNLQDFLLAYYVKFLTSTNLHISEYEFCTLLLGTVFSDAVAEIIKEDNQKILKILLEAYETKEDYVSCFKIKEEINGKR